MYQKPFRITSKKLSNPSDSLNSNVGKGYCEKDGKHFFVTPEGRQSLG